MMFRYSNYKIYSGLTSHSAEPLMIAEIGHVAKLAESCLTLWLSIADSMVVVNGVTPSWDIKLNTWLGNSTLKLYQCLMSREGVCISSLWILEHFSSSTHTRDRADAETCLKHQWLATSVSKMLGTRRLKSFRARRRWLVIKKLPS